MTKIEQLQRERENLHTRIQDSTERINEITAQIEEYNRPLNKIVEIISNYSVVLNSNQSEYSDSVTLNVSDFSGDLSLQQIYKELGYHCTWAHVRHNQADFKPVTELRFTKN